MKHIAAAVAALGLMISPALASDPSPTTRVWNGCSIGLHAGMASNQSTIAGLLEDDDASYLGGANVGCDMQMGRTFVVGAMADYSFGDVDTAVFGTSVYSLKGSWTIAGRVGVRMGDVLPYVLLGWTSVETDPALGITLSDFSGVTMGAGLEAMVTDNISMRVEGRYTTFDTELAGGAIPVDNEQYSVRVGVNYRFNM